MIKYLIVGLLVGCSIPLALNPPITLQRWLHGDQAPVAVPVVALVAPEPRSFDWFVAHPTQIEPTRSDCAHEGANHEECRNADRASLHMFNEQLRAQYFPKGK